MLWTVFVTKYVDKQLSRLPAKQKERILSAVYRMKLDPFSQDVLRLKNEVKAWRLRVGNYRILFEILYEKRIVFVYDVVRRTSTTY